MKKTLIISALLLFASIAQAQDSQKFCMQWEASNPLRDRYELFVAEESAPFDLDSPTRVVTGVDSVSVGDTIEGEFWADANKLWRVAVRACLGDVCSPLSNAWYVGAIMLELAPENFGPCAPD